MRLSAIASLLLACFAFATAHAYEPESGTWWNPAEPGTGYSIEIQDNMMAVLVYGGGANGFAKWYTAAGLLDGNAAFEAELLSFKKVQSIGGAFNNTQELEGSHGMLRILFDPTNNRRATLTWPNGRSIPIERHEFYFVRDEDAAGTRPETLKMLGEWQVVADTSSDPAAFPFVADVLVLNDYFYDADPALRTWLYEGCRPDDGQIGDCSNYALDHHDAIGYYEGPSGEFPNGVQVIVVKDGVYEDINGQSRIWFALYELAIGTNDGSGWFTLYPQGTNPYNSDYTYPARAFRSASRTFVQEGTGPAKSTNPRSNERGLAGLLAAQGVAPKADKPVRTEHAKQLSRRAAMVEVLEARLGQSAR